MLYDISRLLLLLLFKIFFRIRASGCENIPKKGGFILASNHTSYLDPIALGVASPRKLNFMAKHDLFIYPLFSRLLMAVGAFPVKRDSPDASALKEAIRRLKKGKALVLFPEGSRKVNAVSFEPQPGIGFLAVKSEVCVVPAFIKGTDTALPKGARFIRPSRINVQFGQQISIERRQPYSDIAIQIWQEINRLSCV